MPEVDLDKYVRKLAQAFYLTRLRVVDEVLSDMPEGQEKDELREKLMACQEVHIHGLPPRREGEK